MSARYPLVAIYADESCLGNGKAGDTPGGAGALIEYAARDGAVHRFDLWLSEANTTNNRMALRSVIDTFDAISRKGNTLSVRFTTDSRYIVDGMTQWVRGWRARGWTRKGGAVENLELWQAAVASLRDHEVEWRWVRGHNGHAQNEYANHLATRAAAEQDSSNAKLVASAFDEWVSVQKVGSTGAPDPFPNAESFRPAPAL